MNRSLVGALVPWLHVALSVLGLALLVAAAFTVGVAAGLASGGVALLVLAFYLESERSTP